MSTELACTTIMYNNIIFNFEVLKRYYIFQEEWAKKLFVLTVKCFRCAPKVSLCHVFVQIIVTRYDVLPIYRHNIILTVDVYHIMALRFAVCRSLVIDHRCVCIALGTYTRRTSPIIGM